MRSESIGEYTMRTRPPAARASFRLLRLPRTRSRSPNVSTVVPGSMLSSTRRSMYAVTVTQTGHPGPEISRMAGESIPAMPQREICAVWVPQTSIRRSGGPP